MGWPKGEQEYFEDLVNDDRWSWEEIRDAMIEAGYPDRGERAYQSKHYRDSLKQPDIEEPEEQHYDMYRFLRDQPRSLRAICDKFDLPPKRVRAIITEMQDLGYNILDAKAGAVLPTKSFPQIKLPNISIADMVGRDKLYILLISDTHVGGNKSQPTNFNKVINYAVEKYGIEHAFFHGDWSCGIYGYKGHEIDQVPAARPTSRAFAHLAVGRQVWMADKVFPRISGLTYYMLGGNHDWWHVVSAGVDGLRKLTDLRDDMTYLGYDMAKIPLTDKTYMRMWHPTGGVAYAKSYRVQKAIESEGLEALKEAIRKEESPHVSVITAGHLHQAAWVPSHPIYGALLPCFEGQTNYLKRKKLSPDIGGVIMKLIFGDDGRIQHIGYEYIPMTELKNDYKNWPIPEIEELDFHQDDIDVIFKLGDREG